MGSEAIGVRFAGRGGQGIMLAGFLLAQAAMADGLHVVQTQSYGPEARLGAAKSDVIMSPTGIAYPEVLAPDALLCLSRDALAAYSHGMGSKALSVVDEQAARGLDPRNAVVLPLTRIAREAGAAFATNVVGLGVLVGLADLVSERSLREALAARVAPQSRALNMDAFEAGLQLAATVGFTRGAWPGLADWARPPRPARA